MKKIYTLLLVSLALLAVSCSTKSLDIQQHGVTTLDKYATANDAEAHQFIAAVYSVIRGDGYEAVLGGGPATFYYVNYQLGKMSDEFSEGFAYNETASSSTYSGMWSYYYKIAYWCSMIIEKMPANEVASSSVKARIIAEARAIRAISMMQLVQLWGNPPLADHVMDGSEGNTPAEQSWAFIEKELTEAAEVLPSKAGLGGQAAIGGRLTKEAAYAYLGKAQLWQKKYGDAANTLYNHVISTGKYELNPVFDNLNGSVNDFGDENIWEFDFDNSSANATAQEGCFDLACFNPNIYWSGKYAFLMLAWGMGSFPSSSYAEFMMGHDATIDWTTFSMSTSSRYQGTLTDYWGLLMGGNVPLDNPISNCQGYFRIKDVCWADDLVGDFPYYYSKRNVVYMRYAEVLLNYAEAVACGGSNGSGLTGLQALNLVRQRAGLDAAPELSMDNDSYGVKAERRAELFGEGQRFIDLVRWGDAPAVLADCGKKTYMTNVAEGYMGYEVVDSETGGPGFVAGKNELFPIPETDINNNPGGLKQNPNW